MSSKQKITKILLECSNKKVSSKEFEISHAEKLLGMKDSGGWKLPKDSLYRLEKNGLIRKSNKGDTKDSKK